MLKLLLNPFERYAGMAALLSGLLKITITSVLAFFFNVHQDGVLDLHLSDNITAKTVITETLTNWLCMAICIYIAGRIFSKSNIRIIDVAGTQALARAPFLIAVLGTSLLKGSRVIEFINFKFLHQGEAVSFQASDIVFLILSVLLSLLGVIWAIMWMYKAYSISCNVKGTKLVLSFIGALLLAEIISKIILSQIQ